VSAEVRNLIRKMSLADPRWGAARIHGELLKIGIAVSQATVVKYVVRQVEAALANMANLCQESRQGPGFCRLLRCPDDYIPTPIHLCDSRP
jgi:hypothetical protein